MIGVDTNVLVRYITQDDPVQSPRAARLIESLTAELPGFVTLVSIIELVWVLSGCYGCGRAKITEVITALLYAKELTIAEIDSLWEAVRCYENSNADFADCLIERLAYRAGCERILTFDRAAAKHCGMTLIE